MHNKRGSQIAIIVLGLALLFCIIQFACNPKPVDTTLPSIPSEQVVTPRHIPIPISPLIQIQFLGHSGFRIWDNSTTLLVDPLQSSIYTGNVALILLTHEHSDHMDIPNLKITMQNNSNCRIAGPDAVYHELLSSDSKLFQGKVTKLNKGESLIEGVFEINAIASGSIQGYLIQSPEGAIYISGDEFTWFPAADRVTAKIKSLDVALLAVSNPQAYYDGYISFKDFVNKVKPKVVVPMHELRKVAFKYSDHELYSKEVLIYGGAYKIPTLGEIFQLSPTK